MDGVPAVLGHRAFGHADLAFKIPAYLGDCVTGQLPELSDSQSLLWHWKISVFQVFVDNIKDVVLSLPRDL